MFNFVYGTSGMIESFKMIMAMFKISEMRNKDYGYYLDIKVRYFDDIHADLPVTVTFRSKDFEDGIIFTSKEKAEKELEKLKGEINEERE